MKQKKINWMKQSFIYGMIALLFVAFSCDEKEDIIKTFEVKVKLIYPSDYQPQAGVMVKLENTASVAFEAQTDGSGVAEFNVIAGTYRITVTESRVVGTTNIIFNGAINSQVISDPAPNAAILIDLSLIASERTQIIIKELYNGGCPRDDGSGTFSNDQYVILYNNSFEPATLENVCFGMINPYNSTLSTNYDLVGGVLRYEPEGWVPAGMGIWTFQQTLTLAPCEQIVVAMRNAVDNTPTYSNSINFNNASYYCMYDPESGFNMASYYPPPAPAIPTTHYLKAYHFGQGGAWALSQNSPAFFVFATPGDPQAFIDNEANHDFYNTSIQANSRRKVPVEWVIDAIEVFVSGAANNMKRLNAVLDAGYVELRNTQGFTLYRNVDKAETEAIPENEGKIVYGYSLGTQGMVIDDQEINGTTDPSGIDAEASIKNGARIIYKDTNNSGNDFHQRRKASLRD